MSTLSSDKLVFFPGDLTDSNQVGANNLDGYGIQIGSTVVSSTNTSLDVFAALADGYGTKLASTAGSLNVALTTSSGGSLDTNFGTVGANTLRSAAQIGNATGAADFNRGATTAQTVRVAGNNYDGYGNAISSTVVSGKNGLDVNIIDPITATLSADFNYGTVGASTLRSAAQIGNSTGQADFNRGATSAQTLRVTNNTSDGYGVAISSTIVGGKDGLDVNLINASVTVTGTVATSNFPATVDTNYGTVGANTLRAAAQIGNSTGQADFNAGTTGAQTLRVTSNLSDGYGTKLSSTIVGGKDGLDVNLINASVAVTGTVAVSNFPATVDTNYGTVGANTIRTASQIGNATGAADFNRGVTGAQTLRVTSNLNDGYGIQLQSLAGSLYVGGNVADAAVDAGNPVKVGSRVVSAPLAATSAGNRADLISDLYRRLYINDSPNIGVAATAVTVGTTMATLIASPLGGRRRILIQNLGSVPVFVGQTGVTTASGFRISASGTLALELGPDVGIFAISGTAGQNVRVLELA